MTIKGGTNKACAACKYQRRRCSKECPLAPYFPADQPKTFSNAHRLFGVSNIMRILKQVRPDERDEAMKSIIYESHLRAKYPVDGSYGVIRHYQCMEYHAMEQLRYVQMLLAFYKENSRTPLITMDQCSLLPPSSDEFPIYNHEVSSFDGILDYVCDANYIDMKTLACRSDITNVSTSPLDANSELMSMHGLSYHENDQLDYIAAGSTNINADAMDAKSAKFNLMMADQGLTYHQKHDISEYDDTSFDGFADDRRAYLECKVACEPLSSVELY